MPTSTSSSATPRSRGLGLLVALFALLALNVAVCLLRGQSLRDDGLSLSALVLFVVSAVLGSRVYAAVIQRRDAPRPARE